MQTDPTPQGCVLVRCSTDMLAQLAGNGMSEPLVVIGITAQEDGTFDLIMQRPSRSALEAAIRDRFQAERGPNYGGPVARRQP